MKNILLNLLLLGMLSHTFAQPETFRIKLSTVDPPRSPRYGVVPVYEVVSTTQIEYKKKNYSIILPKGEQDLAMAFLSSRSMQNTPIPQVLPILIANYQSKHPFLYQDKNNNLDFTDDGPPMSYQSDSIETEEFTYVGVPVLSKNMGKNARPFKFYLIKPPHISGFNKRKEYFSKRINAHVTDGKYWFGVLAINEVGGEVAIGQDRFQINIQDTFGNTIFGDNRDRFFTRKLDEGWEVADVWIIEKNKKTIIELGDNVYQLSEIDPQGQHATFTLLEPKENLRFHYGEKVSPVHITLIDGEVKSLDSYYGQGKYTLLYFWGTWCGPCTARLPQLKELFNAHRDRLTVIGLACGDKKKRVKSYVKKKQISWDNALVNNNLTSKFNINAFPTYILLNPQGEVVDERAFLHEVQQYLNLEE